MTIKKEAAFHEAGHAVMAYLSEFHYLAHTINLKHYGAGETFITLSKKKLEANGKKPTEECAKDKDVAADFAVVLCAGKMAEEIAATKDTSLAANPECAAPDYELMIQQLENAGLSKNFDQHETKSKMHLENNWELVNRVAEYLFNKQLVDAVDLIDFIKST